MPEIVVHHLELSRSHRVLWLLEELEVDYELVVHQRDPKTFRAGTELRDLHPLGKFPLVVLDGEVLAESGHILETLGERLAPGTWMPAPDTEAFRRVRYFLHYTEGSLLPPLLVALLMGKVRDAPVPFFLRPVVKRIADSIHDRYTGPELELQFRFLEGELDGREWFAGDRPTLADVQLSYGIEAGASRGGITEDHPRLRAWLDRVRARPAWQRAVDKGGPVMPA